MGTKSAKVRKIQGAAKPKKAVAPKPKQPANKPSQPKGAKTATASRQPVPWLKLKEMWESGASYEAMARATDPHFNQASSDPTKPTRAKICRARKQGVRIGGKLVRFGPRGEPKQFEQKGDGKPVQPVQPKKTKPDIQKGNVPRTKASPAMPNATSKKVTEMKATLPLPKNTVAQPKAAEQRAEPTPLG